MAFARKSLYDLICEVKYSTESTDFVGTCIHFSCIKYNQLITQFPCDFDEYEIQYFGWELKIQRIETIQKTRVYFSFLLAFYEHVHLGPNQSLNN